MAGEPLADLSAWAGADAHVLRLQETRLLALEGRIEAELRLGRHTELIAEVQTLARAHPLREELHRQLMLALYRAGRQAQSLDVFQQLRRTLAGELGVQPSAPLRELHGRILAGDPGLAVPAVPAGGAPAAAAAAPDGDGPRQAGPAPTSHLRFQLPSETTSFTGRTQELDQLLALAEETPTAPTPERWSSPRSTGWPASASRRWHCGPPTTSGHTSRTGSCSSTCTGTPPAWNRSTRARHSTGSCARWASPRS
ncbi:AfsR/SARP family transcriptional regulator [Streptacidiphilus sp. 4-A2]|nr:AfsR/SARP family transcriptional regulator [Streptacidiphilus sp. 4-A2]